jgi:hypothetical protein
VTSLSLNHARIILLRSQLLISYLSPTFIPLYPLKRRKRCITQIPLNPQIYTNTNSSFLLHVPESLPNTHQPRKLGIPWVLKVIQKALFQRPHALCCRRHLMSAVCLEDWIKGYSCILLSEDIEELSCRSPGTVHLESIVGFKLRNDACLSSDDLQ